MTAATTGDSVVDLPGCSVSVAPDVLFGRMAARGQGWSVQNEHEDFRPALSSLDLLILEAIRRAAQRRSRLAIGVSRVAVGMVLAPVIYAALRALIQHDRPNTGTAENGYPLQSGDRLMIASRSHAIRDLLAESVLTFQGLRTRLAQFPTYRLGRDGALKPAVFGRLPWTQRPPPEQMLRTATPLVVYDFWPLPPEMRLPQVAAVFAEVTEQDRADSVERLGELIERSGAGSAIAIINFNDVGKRKQLAALGFDFMAARTTAEGRENELQPTFTGVDRVAPKTHRVIFQSVAEDAPAAKPLTEAFQLLAEVHGRAPSDEPYPMALGKAWYVLDQLAGCPSSLQHYEALRRLDPYSQSLRFRIDRLEHLGFGPMPGAVRGALMTRWPHVIGLLRAAYDLLLESNPKWWPLAETVLYADAPLGVLLGNRLQAQALREDLLVEFGWSEDGSPVRIRSIAAARRADERFDKILLLSHWSDHQRALLFSLLPGDVWVLGYPFEAPLLEKRLQVMRLDLDVTLASSTRQTLGGLLGVRVRSADEYGRSAVQWDGQAVAAARESARRYWNRPCDQERADSEDELLFERAAARASESNSDSAAEDDADSEEIETVTILFTDGVSLTVATDRELLVLPVGASATEQRFAPDVRPGERVLLLSSGEHGDLFTAALARTSHLMDTDRRVLTRWRDGLVAVRHRFPPRVRGTGPRFVEALRELGCTRDPATTRGWLEGSTLAPREAADIARILRLAGSFADPDLWAGMIDREISAVRGFHSRIGRRIGRRMLGEAESSDRIDQEIDELLEQTDLRTVEIVGAVEPRSKRLVAGLVAEEDEP
jgi:hypothetical protein